mmetsp:Transcript_23522/g.44736  ORF Transcript_23522/g.44736 Transcript_23522/m.44736 type:complete len:223 (+) Transcript_23522:462-1130(+)
MASKGTRAAMVHSVEHGKWRHTLYHLKMELQHIRAPVVAPGSLKDWRFGTQNGLLIPVVLVRQPAASESTQTFVNQKQAPFVVGRDSLVEPRVLARGCCYKLYRIQQQVVGLLSSMFADLCSFLEVVFAVPSGGNRDARGLSSCSGFVVFSDESLKYIELWLFLLQSKILLTFLLCQGMTVLLSLPTVMIFYDSPLSFLLRSTSIDWQPTNLHPTRWEYFLL